MKTLCLTIILFFLPLNYSAAKTLVFSTIENLTLIEPISEILKEAYGKIGIKIKYEEYPAKRSIIFANNGIFDGEMGRRDGKEKKYRNLIMVDVPIVCDELVAYTRLKDIKIDGWGSLKPYSVGILRGMECVESETLKMDRFIINSPEQLIRMIEHSRIDIAVIHKSFGIIRRRELDKKNIITTETPLIKTKIYHYLHRKNEYLFPKIRNGLMEMKREGRIQKIYLNFIKRYTSL